VQKISVPVESVILTIDLMPLCHCFATFADHTRLPSDERTRSPLQIFSIAVLLPSGLAIKVPLARHKTP